MPYNQALHATPSRCAVGFPRSQARSARVSAGVGLLSVRLAPFVECTDVRRTESCSECNRRIRLRHVATRPDLVTIWVRVSSRLRLPVA